MIAEALIYFGILAACVLFVALGRSGSKGLTPTRTLRSSDVAHAARRSQRPRTGRRLDS